MQVIFDMRYFFLVLLITIFAFGDSMMKLALANGDKNHIGSSFIDSTIYTYRMIIGDFEVDDFGPV